jgi:hypothetical protein
VFLIIPLLRRGGRRSLTGWFKKGEDRGAIPLPSLHHPALRAPLRGRGIGGLIEKAAKIKATALSVEKRCDNKTNSPIFRVNEYQMSEEQILSKKHSRVF